MQADSILPKATGAVIGLGVALIVVGILSISAPRQSGMTIGVLVGICLFLGGFFRVCFAWLAPSWGSAGLRFLTGGLAVVAGVVMVTNPSTGPRALAVVAIVYFIADGLSEILLALRLPPAAGGIWIMVSGIVSLALGIFIWRQWPLSGEQAVAILVGIKLILDGVVLLALGSGARAIAKTN
jgi:uncharacterized membrane protein HdeD (DUF308 family)